MSRFSDAQLRIVVRRFASPRNDEGKEMLFTADHGCLQYWGGMGFTNETPVSRAYRDGRLTSIGGGADEVMLMVLCKRMGTLPGSRGNA